MYDEMSYPNEGPLWPCGCLVGDPACQCPLDVLDEPRNTGAVPSADGDIRAE